ncbi:MAG: hypothetical protein ACYC6B_00305 [Thermoleophilia bacterium]
MLRRSSFRPGRQKIFLACTLLSLIAVSALALGCGSSTTERPTYDAITGGSNSIAAPKDPVSQDVVEKIVSRKIGEEGNAGLPIIRQITLMPETGGTFVDIQLNRTSACHPGQLVGTAITMSQNVMSAVFRYTDVTRVQLTMFGTSESLADKDKAVARIMLTKETASTVDWFQFTDANVERLANEFWVEPTLYENWKQYGGGAITDQSQLNAANAAAAAAAATPTTP